MTARSFHLKHTARTVSSVCFTLQRFSVDVGRDISTLSFVLRLISIGQHSDMATSSILIRLVHKLYGALGPP